jgi:peptide/nickel transport system permease protein
MGQYLTRRVLISIPLLFGITIILFFLADLMPGDAVLAMITDESPLSEELIALRRGQLGLDQPLYIQYGRWMGQVLQGNLGYSFANGRPVSEIIGARVLATLELMGAALIISLIFGITLGVISALKQYSGIDYSLTLFGFTGLSLPDFFVALILIYIFALRLEWLPSSGISTAGEPFSLIDNLRHLILPATSLALFRTAIFMRFTRASMLEVINEDHMRTAKAKGLRSWTITRRHGLRNALIPIVTILGMTLPILFGGAVIIETIFQWPGIGLMFIDAVIDRDGPVIMAYVLITAILVLSFNLLTDITYSWLDPRVRFD